MLSTGAQAGLHRSDHARDGRAGAGGKFVLLQDAEKVLNIVELRGVGLEVDEMDVTAANVTDRVGDVDTHIVEDHDAGPSSQRR